MSPPVSPPVSPPAPPPNPCARINGNGTLRQNPEARFTIDVHYKRRTDTFKGSISYRDTAGDLRFESTEITGIDKRGDTATITGSGLANGRPVTFRVTASDSEPDLFSIQLSNGYSAGGPVKGKVKIREQC